MAERDPQFDQEVETAPTPAPAGTRRRNRYGKIVAMASVPLVLIAGAAWYYLANSRYVSTDNAYIGQDKVSVSALVTGNITEVAVRENQQVRTGDLLFRIDPAPFQIAIAQADAAIAAAQVKVVGLQTDFGNTNVDITGAGEDVAYYEQQYKREDALMQRGFNTRARLDSAEHDLADARSKLAEAQARARAAKAALATSPIAPGVNPAVLAAQAQKRKAQLDLAHSVVRAPVSGTVSQTGSLQLGQMMISGLPAMTIVRGEGGWVEANFKETQLAQMRVGQLATLTFDAYPGVTVKGHVSSIGAGTGSVFSVLPAQNANGNWIKVTQRVPVRIAIDGRTDRPLIAGLSTHVVVDTGR